MNNNAAGAVLIPRPNFAQVALSPQGQQMMPALSGTPNGNAPGSPLSSGWVIMRPGWVSNRHRHDNSWVHVQVLFGHAVTLWGPDYEHKILQGPGESALIRPGVNHYAVNASDTEWVIAYEIRSSIDISLDNIPLEGIAKVGFDLDVPVDELNKLFDHPTPPIPPSTGPAGQMPIQPFQGHKDEDLGRWPH